MGTPNEIQDCFFEAVWREFIAANDWPFARKVENELGERLAEVWESSARRSEQRTSFART